MTPLEQIIAAVLEKAAQKATSFLVGAPENDIPLRNPMAHEISDAIRALSVPDLARELEHLMQGEPVGWLWKTKGAGSWFYCHDLNWLDPTLIDEIDAQQIYTHPSDAESLREEVADVKRQNEVAVAAMVRSHQRAEKAEAERDAAETRVRELEAQLAALTPPPPDAELDALVSSAEFLASGHEDRDGEGTADIIRQLCTRLDAMRIDGLRQIAEAQAPDVGLDALVAEIIAAWPPVLAIIRDYDEQFPYAELEGDDEKVWHLNRAITALRARKGGAS